MQLFNSFTICIPIYNCLNIYTALLFTHWQTMYVCAVSIIKQNLIYNILLYTISISY